MAWTDTYGTTTAREKAGAFSTFTADYKEGQDYD
jgi:hypothetical protein